MAAGSSDSSDIQPATGVGDDQRRDERFRRGGIALIVLVALAVLFLWWLWSQTGVVPDVTGMNQSDARTALNSAGFEVGSVRFDKTALEQPGMVDDQGIAPGTRALKGAEVDLFIAEGTEDRDDQLGLSGIGDDGFDTDDGGDSIRDRGDDEYNTSLGSRNYYGVPQVLNQTESSAVSELRAAGYRVKIVFATNGGGIADGRVFYQTPEPGGTTATGVVEIWISTGHPTGGHRKRPNIPWEKS